MNEIIPSFADGDLGNGFYQNPILQADYSDPDVVAVGDNFYLVASSFNHVPGLPVLHSRDLLHWELINYALTRLPSPKYDAVQPGHGVWAPSIRYQDGWFRIYYSMPDEGIFMCETKDPAGLWSEPCCLSHQAGWIDPCPFWDEDGRAWLVHAFAYSRSQRKHQLQLLAMSPDGRSLIGDGLIIYDGMLDLPTLEGPKLYKRDGWYYIFAPAGGVATGWQAVLRSRQITGPYETKIVLQQGTTAVNGPHQGAWVQTIHDEDWFIHFQDQDLYGRVVHLQPMCWVDGWPRIGSAADSDVAMAEPVCRHIVPKLVHDSGSAQMVAAVPQIETFVNGQPGLAWQWLANPQLNWLGSQSELSAGTAAGLRLNCVLSEQPSDKASFYWIPQLLLQKFCARSFQVAVSLSPYFQNEGDRCGLTVYGERFAALELAMDHEHQIWWQYRFGWRTDRGDVQEQIRILQLLPDNPRQPLQLYLRVNEGGICQFGYEFENASGSAATYFITDLPITESIHWVTPQFAAGPGRWVGAKFGIYACGQSDSKIQAPGQVLFQRVQVEPLARQ